MEIHAYNKEYLANARNTLGIAVDYAVQYQGMSIDLFFQKFIDSGVAKAFEKGAPAVTVGVSGVELYCMVTGDVGRGLPQYQSLERSPEYWLGWALAYFQYAENRSFKEIFSVMKPSEMLYWYKTMHEEDITSFVSALRQKMMERKTNLKILRERIGLTQAELSALSGVSVPTIRAYEQRTHDIRNAQYNVLLALATALQCSVQELTDESMGLQPTKYPFYPTKDDFSQQLLQETQKLQKQIAALEQEKAKLQAQRAAQQFGYVSQFPFEKVQVDKQNYQMNSAEFVNNWENYWENQIQRTISNQSECQQLIDVTRSFVRGWVGSKIDASGSKGASIAYDAYCTITAKNVAELAYHAAKMIETASRKEK